MDWNLNGASGVIVGIIVGGLITLAVAWIFHLSADKSLKAVKSNILQATADLEAEADRIRRMTNLVLLALEHSGLKVNVNRDKDGYPTSIALDLSGNFTGSSNFKGTLSDGNAGQ